MGRHAPKPLAWPCRLQTRYESEASGRAQWKARRKGYRVEGCPWCGGWHIVKPAPEASA
mgnify:CR=1 FL=1